MKTQEFLSLLQAHQDKALIFEYNPGKLVGANYHITEVKHVMIDSIDCGANSDSWNETIIQLWESPLELLKTQYLSVNKATGILNKVAGMRAFDPASEIKIEYGNKNFHTTQLFIGDHKTQGSRLVISLETTKTDCKAKVDCGIPSVITKVASAMDCCKTSSGCC